MLLLLLYLLLLYKAVLNVCAMWVLKIGSVMIRWWFGGKEIGLEWWGGHEFNWPH